MYGLGIIEDKNNSMAISKKGSRKIVVDGHEFRWKTTGKKDTISVIIWPVDNDRCRIVGNIGYHNKPTAISASGDLERSQIVVTNRIIREIILHYGVAELLQHAGQINLTAIEDIYDVSGAVRR